MYLLSQNRKRLVNMNSIDCLVIEDKAIYAKKNEKKMLLGIYEDENAALSEYQSIIENLEPESVLVME